MDKCGGLKLLLAQFVNDSENRCKVLSSLHKLACSIEINNPCVKRPLNSSLEYNDGTKMECIGKTILTIKLDDGQQVEADRDFLVDHVGYFKAMLTGSFKEAEQDCITLSNVSYEALNYLLFLLGLDVKNMEPRPLKINLNTLLEVITLTDSYLLENLMEWLTSCIEYYMINVESASQIYKWSIESNTNILRIETAAFLLTAKINDLERYQLCESILENQLCDQLYIDFQNLISRFLKLKYFNSLGVD